MADMLYIIAKAPRVGLAKTRLGRAIGDEAAVALYRAFLQDLAERFVDAPFECGWYVTPPDAWNDLSPLVRWNGCEARVLLQREGDLTERQRELFLGALDRGEERVVLIASDSPHLTVEVVEQAFRELDRHDLVFGPTHDGGYYLIGMRGWHDVFQKTLMSTGTELEDIIVRAEHAGLSVGRVETTFDVDEVEDLEHLSRLVEYRTDLAATRAALVALGLHADGRHDASQPAVTRSVSTSPAEDHERMRRPRGGGAA
jgi:uncharacterized protein